MNKKIEINQTKIKGGCQLGRKVVTQNSKSDLSLNETKKIVITIETFTVSNFFKHEPSSY